MNTPTLPPPDLLRIARDGADVYVTTNNGLERFCTMDRPGRNQRFVDARMIVRAYNSRAALIEALKGAESALAAFCPHHPAGPAARAAIALVEREAA